MQELSDAQLLRAYAEHGQEAAFREIVTRHTDVVYSSALRQVGSPDLARDVAQSVFGDLARKAKPLAAELAGNASLLGWLYRSTRFAALRLLRDERRRHTRERQVMEHFTPASEESAHWDRVSPVLDEAMADLDDEDREALLLRFFKNHDFRAVGAALGVSDDAAQKRVSRALERLRAHITRRGVTTTAVALTTALSANAITVAPAGLAATLSSAALAGTTAAITATATATKVIAMTTLQKSVVTATVAVLAGVGIYEARQASQLRDQVQTFQQSQTPLTEENQRLQSKLDEATSRMAGLREDNERLNRNTGEVLRLRGEISRLRSEKAITSGEAVATSVLLLDSKDPNWRPNWRALVAYDLSKFEITEPISCSVRPRMSAMPRQHPFIKPGCMLGSLAIQMPL